MSANVGACGTQPHQRKFITGPAAAKAAAAAAIGRCAAPSHINSSSCRNTSAAQDTLPARLYNPSQWTEDAAPLLQRLDHPPSTTPQQLWRHLSTSPPGVAEQELRQHLDLASCRLLLSAAAATCSTQQQWNELSPLVQAVGSQQSRLLAEFTLEDFRQLMQLCSKARIVPDAQWLSDVFYADAGGFERFFKTEDPSALVLLAADMSAMLGSIQALAVDAQQHMQLLQQQKQQQQQPTSQQQLSPGHQQQGKQPYSSPETAAQTGPDNSSSNSGRDTSSNIQATTATTSSSSSSHVAAETAALASAFSKSSENLKGIFSDPVLAADLSGLCGYWLLRKWLPQVSQQQPDVLLAGLCSLPSLAYVVLPEDAHVLLGCLTSNLAAWSSSQLAAAVTACLPCLGSSQASRPDELAQLFAAVEAAAGGMSSSEAGEVLYWLSRVEGYAPSPQVARRLLDQVLGSPAAIQQLSQSKLYAVLQAAEALGATPSSSQLELIVAKLGSSRS